MSSANQSRKHDSGYQKRKRKQRIEDLTQSQKGAMDRFIIQESQVSSDNHSLDQDPTIGDNDCRCFGPGGPSTGPTSEF
jgi:hypothetical protein